MPLSRKILAPTEDLDDTEEGGRFEMASSKIHGSLYALYVLVARPGEDKDQDPEITTPANQTDNITDLASSQETEQDFDVSYHIITSSEANEYYPCHGPATSSPSERIHTEWLGKRLMLKKDRIIIEIGPRQIYREFSIQEIPETSKFLMEFGQRELCNRHMWIKEVDDAMFRKYWFLQGGEGADGMGSWGDVIRLVVTASALEDEVVQGQALAALSAKAKIEQFNSDQMFTREDIDWVYEHTQSGDPLRAVIVPLAVHSEDLIARLKGPAEFLVDVATHLEELTIERDREAEMSIKIKLPQSPRPPSNQTAWPDMNYIQVPRMKRLGNFTSTSPGTPTMSLSKPEEAASNTTPPRHSRLVSTIENTDSAPHLKHKVPSQHNSSGALSLPVASDNTYANVRNMHHEAKHFPSSPTQLPSLNPVSTKTPSTYRYSTFVPFSDTHITSEMPALQSSSNKPPKTVNRVLEKYASASVRAAVLNPKPSESANYQETYKEDTSNTPSKTNATPLPKTRTPTPPRSSAQTSSKPPVSASGSEIPKPANRFKYSKSVLGNKLNARPVFNTQTDNSADAKEVPMRQPSLPPTVDELQRTPEKNFAERRS